MSDVLIIGGGPAGMAAALGLSGRGLDVTVLDIGHEPPEHKLAGLEFDDALTTPDFLGREYEYLEQLGGVQKMAKLRAPLQRYVTAQPELSPLQQQDFSAVASHALGGLANIWGAQLLRYDEADLQGFAVTAAELAPHYNALQEEIGLTGAADDLERFYGPAHGLQPPHPLDANATALLRRYNRLRRPLNSMGVYIGHPRTAILTQAHKGRPAHTYDGMEFFRPQNPSVYSPAFTLRRLAAEGSIRLVTGLQALSFTEQDGRVSVQCRDVKTGALQELAARKLVLAAGALNTARLVLASRGDTTSQLPLLDNRLSYIPLLNPLQLGAGRDSSSTYLQLNLCYEQAGRLAAMGSFYSVRGLPLSDFLTSLPFGMRDSLHLLPHILPALLVLHLWHPADAPVVSVQYNGTGLAIRGSGQPDGKLERSLQRKLALLGFFSLPSQIQYPVAGNSFHYCGTLPMRDQPGVLETGRDGRLGTLQHVYVADGAVFPRLSAKNLSYTIMANARRVAMEMP